MWCVNYVASVFPNNGKLFQLFLECIDLLHLDNPGHTNINGIMHHLIPTLVSIYFLAYRLEELPRIVWNFRSYTSISKSDQPIFNKIN